MKLAVIFNEHKLSGKLTRLFTGCYAYHIGFVDLEIDAFWDMNCLFRRVEWAGRYEPEHVVLFDSPWPITAEELDAEIISDVRTFCEPGGMLKAFYGFVDYAGFALRPLYHLFGRSTRNFGGEICSEAVNNILVAKGWSRSPWAMDAEPPSPCDWFRWLRGREEMAAVAQAYAR